LFIYYIGITILLIMVHSLLDKKMKAK